MCLIVSHDDGIQPSTSEVLNRELTEGGHVQFVEENSHSNR